jgi:hypothetical protein
MIQATRHEPSVVIASPLSILFIAGRRVQDMRARVVVQQRLNDANKHVISLSITYKSDEGNSHNAPVKQCEHKNWNLRGMRERESKRVKSKTSKRVL